MKCENIARSVLVARILQSDWLVGWLVSWLVARVLASGYANPIGCKGCCQVVAMLTL